MRDGRLSVLLVDGDADIRIIVRLALGLDPDLEVHEAESGETALQMLSLGLQPHLVLLDTQLPGLSGEDVARRILNGARTRYPPIVFLTAAARAKEIDSLRAVGAAGVITKPFDPLSLAIELRKIVQDGTARR